MLEQLANTVLTPAEQEPDGFARIYYEFKTKQNRTIYSVCMWSGSGGIFVNGLVVEEEDIFYDVIMPFLPTDAAEALDRFVNYGFGGPNNDAHEKEPADVIDEMIADWLDEMIADMEEERLEKRFP